MSKLFDRFKYKGLFIKMFIIMVVSIIAVSVTTTWTTINVSERVFTETFSITNSKVINQINNNLDTFNYSIALATNKLAQSGTAREFMTEADGSSLANFRSFYAMGNVMKRINSGMDAYGIDITVAGINGRIFASSGQSPLAMTHDELMEHPLTLRSLESPRRILYQHMKSKHGVPLLVATRPLSDHTTDKVYGMIFFTMTEKEFAGFYNTYTSEGNEVAVISGNGTIVSSGRKEWIGTDGGELLAYVKSMEEAGKPYMNVAIQNREHIVLSRYLSSLDYYIVNLIDKKTAIGQLTDMPSIIISVGVIVGVALIIVFLISRRLTRSLTRLVKQISTISKYEFHHKVSVGGSYETRELGLAFNGMLEELQDYVAKLVQTEKQRRNAELEALQGQINPHFLYNTLASVKFMVQHGDRERAAETINALISLLQNMIGNVSETITLSQELVNMKNYVLINHVRYGERIKMNYFIAPDCLGCHLPKLIIQPFIENAFFHGFNAKAEGHIYFMASKEADALICEVVDNGDGFDMKADQGAENLKPSGKRQLFTGIGVRNVHERVQLLYGESYGVEINSQPGEGTRVKIRLPIIKE